MSVQIEQVDNSFDDQIESNLLEDLRRTLDQADNRCFTLIAKSDSDEIVGGLIASTSYGWLLIKVVWVLETRRKKGIGAKLVADAESRAQQSGCHAAWLDTSSPPAKSFYERLGYVEFGQLKNDSGQMPESHHRWFLKKTLR